MRCLCSLFSFPSPRLFLVYLGRRRKVPRVQVGRVNFRAARSLDDDDFLGNSQRSRGLGRRSGRDKSGNVFLSSRTSDVDKRLERKSWGEGKWKGWMQYAIHAYAPNVTVTPQSVRSRLKCAGRWVCFILITYISYSMNNNVR